MITDLPRFVLKYMFSFLNVEVRLTLRKVCKRFKDTLFIGDFWLRCGKKHNMPRGHYKHLVWKSGLFEDKDITVDKLIINVSNIRNLKFLENNKVKRLKLYINSREVDEYLFSKVKLDYFHIITPDYSNYRRLQRTGHKLTLDDSSNERKKKESYICYSKDNTGYTTVDYNSLSELYFYNPMPHEIFNDEGVLIFPDGIKKLKIVHKDWSIGIFVVYPTSLEYLSLNITVGCAEAYSPWIREFPKSLKRLKIYTKIKFSNYFEVKYKF